MGILDEAIREHLELKRQHGAGESELKQLEDDAFGPPARPGDPTGEQEQAPVMDEPATELLSEPSSEPEPESAPEPTSEVEEDQLAPVDSQAEIAQEEPSPGPSTEESERHAIAEQPTEIFDVEGEYAAEARSPSEEELVAEEISEPRLAPADSLEGLDHAAEDESLEEAEPEPPAPAVDTAEDEDFEDDDFFNEQRLSEELDQALEAPRESAPSSFEEDVENEEPEEPAGLEEPEPSAQLEEVREEPISEEAPREERHEDVLEETPDFLEETPEDDELWFEQRPPKDFDFDD